MRQNGYRKMIKVLAVFGTRPEAIKMCPVIKELKKYAQIETVICVTGQHKEMLAPILKAFHVTPQYNLDIMRDSQTLFDITISVLTRIKDILDKERPEVVLVHGDTTTAFAAALACYYRKIPVCHVEAGLRTYNNKSPYPEEFNRQSVDAISDIFFAPTECAKENLLREGREKDRIYVTGNTVIDALRTTIHRDYAHELLEWAGEGRMILLTAHRRENQGDRMREMFAAIKEVICGFEDVRVVYPVHLNPEVQNAAKEIFGNESRVRLVAPLDVIDFHNIMSRAYFIMTDSGGIQEEAPSLGKPVLVMRDTTERPEGVEAGTVKLAGTSRKGIKDAMHRLLADKEEYQRMAKAKNPYGDGKASQRIAEIIMKRWG